jgi:predicted Fe-Mo cluster-binding NifX family protein
MDKPLKICIPSRGPDPGDLVDERFGRAPFFVIYDTGSEKTESHKNSAAESMGGVGPKAAQFLINHSVNILLAERVGGNAVEALKAGGIRVFIVEEKGITVRDAVSAYLNGSLREQ